MSQGTYAGLHVLEDFLFHLHETTELALADAVPERISGVTISAKDTAIVLAMTVDEPGGIMQLLITDDTADDGFDMYMAPLRPSDGAATMEVRFKTNDISGTNLFGGFRETFTVADPGADAVPFTMATTTITVANLGVSACVFVDHNATNEDFHFAAAQDATGAAGIDLTDPPINGGRAGADLSGATGDDNWMIVRVEIEADGTAFGFVGSTHTDAIGGGEALKLIGQTDRGALDADAMVTPYLRIENNAGTGVNPEVDYFAIRGDRDWTV